MCITFIKLSPKDKIKFLIGFNREVELTKPTKQAGYWPDDSNILGGLDLALGGACLAMNVLTGHIAILTNYSELPPEDRFKLNMKSRGDLVRNWVQSNFYEKYQWKPEEAGQNYMKIVLNERKAYNPFNLIVGRISDPNLIFYGLDYMSDKIEILKHNQFIGMSNSSFKCPYPKLTKGLDYLKNEETGLEQKDKLFKLLHKSKNYQAREEFDPEDSIFVEPFFSPTKRFIIGTISTTIITVDNQDQFILDEYFYTFPEISHNYDQNVSYYRKLKRTVRKITAIRNIVKNNKLNTTTLSTTIKGKIGISQ